MHNQKKLLLIKSRPLTQIKGSNYPIMFVLELNNIAL